MPLPQWALWPELDATPDHFTLCGATALALRIGHRQSVDFDFFSRTAFDPAALARKIPYLAGAETVPLERTRLRAAVAVADPTRLPVLTPHLRRDNRRAL